MAQDLRCYTDLKSSRAAAASQRAASAKRRAALLGLLLVSAVVLVGFAAAGVLSWWLLAAPGVGTALTLSWGSIAASKGRKEDLGYLEKIRAVERRLEKSPAGRAALHSGKLRDNSHWAKVAKESIDSATREGTLNDALERANASTAVKDGESLTADLGEVELAQDAPNDAEGAAKTESNLEQKVQNAPAVETETTGESVSDTRKWKLAEIPAPTYTLQPDTLRREVEIATETTAEAWEETATPMRPKTAQILPAAAALSSEEIQAQAPLDLETILERRRA